MLCIPTDTRREFTCHTCKQTKLIPIEGGTGYGCDKDHNTICYDCCAVQDKRQMEETGKIVLYLDTHKGTVTNWPGTLSIRCDRIKVGGHNWGINRYDAWFTDHRGKEWHGVQYGDNTQIVHCHRMRG